MWFVLLLLACGESGPRRGRGPVTGTDSGPSAASPRFVVAPTLGMPAVSQQALVRRLELVTDVPTAVQVVSRGGGDTLVQRFDAAQEHVLPIVGFRFETAYEVEVTATTDAGAELQASFEVTTGPLPSPFPEIDVLALAPERMEPGFTVLPVQVPAGKDRYAIVLDHQARVRWLLALKNHLTDLRFDDGDVWLIQRSGVERRDIQGSVITRWAESGTAAHTLTVDVGGFHHEAYPIDGGFVSLGRASVEIPDYPSAESPLGPGAPATLYVPRLVEIGLDGTVRQDLDLGALLDTRRISMSSHDETSWGLDWAHANAVVPDGDGWLVSLRHQDSVVRITAEGSVDWILSNPAGWWPGLAEHRLTAASDMRWPYHMHAPERLPDGGLLLFDNGNHQTTPYHPDPPRRPATSRVVAYDIDPVARTVSERWSIDSTRTGWLFSDAVGDADFLPTTGHVLAVYGRLEGEAELANADVGRAAVHARVVEVDPSTPELPVMDLRIWSRPDDVEEGWTVYRAQRIDRLHASVVLPGEPGWAEAIAP